MGTSSSLWCFTEGAGITLQCPFPGTPGSQCFSRDCRALVAPCIPGFSALPSGTPAWTIPHFVRLHSLPTPGTHCPWRSPELSWGLRFPSRRMGICHQHCHPWDSPGQAIQRPFTSSTGTGYRQMNPGSSPQSLTDHVGNLSSSPGACGVHKQSSRPFCGATPWAYFCLPLLKKGQTSGTSQGRSRFIMEMLFWRSGLA